MVPVPLITSATSATFTVGIPGSFTVTAPGLPGTGAVFGETGNLPAGVTFNPATGVLGGTPAAGAAGSYTLGFTAINGAGPFGFQNNFNLSINQAPAGQPPVINPISPQTVTDGDLLSFTVTATAPSANGSPVPLTFSLSAGVPARASINAQTGLFTWTPAEGNGVAPGVYRVTVSAAETNAPQLSSSLTFTVTVGPTSTTQGSGLAVRTTVAEGVSQSAEYYSNIITAAYTKYLGRAPEASGLAYWLNQMQNQGLTDEKLEAGFIGSQEYIANHGGTGPNWIQGLYVDLLGRTPAASEVQYWVAQLNNGMSPADIAYGFAASQERETQRVAADYQQYLGRGARPDEIQYWVGIFLNGADNEKVIAGFIGSQEYFQSHGNNIVDWLFADYRATLQREPDTGGYQYWLNQLQ